MISVIGVYEDVNFIINKGNGFISKDEYNNACWLAQLKLLDWLTGNSDGASTPELESSQKNKDWLSVFAVPLKMQVEDGIISKPEDYYLFDALSKLNKKTGTPSNKPNKPIDLLPSNKFNERVNTFIEELKPSVSPIARLSGDIIEFEPSDVGSVELIYIRFPKKSVLVTSEDDVYHDEIPDVNASEDFEWNEGARNVLVRFIVDEMSIHTRETALKQFNSVSPEIGGNKK